MEKFDFLTAATVAPVCQPALLDRWALGLTHKQDVAEGFGAHADGIYAWFNSALTLPVLSEHPKLLGRLYVALIHVMNVPDAAKSSETIDAQKHLVMELFDKLPPHAWAWMLELGLQDAGHIAPRDRLRLFSDFVRDPLASASLATPTFCNFVIAGAALVWHKLQDAPCGERSKFDVFCDRFGLPR